MIASFKNKQIKCKNGYFNCSKGRTNKQTNNQRNKKKNKKQARNGYLNENDKEA